MKSKDRIGGAVFAIFGILVTILATQIKIPANLSEPGPRLFPYIAGIGMTVCSLGMVFTAKKQEARGPFLTREGWIRLGVVAAALVFYYLALEYIGFLISTPVFTFAIILILSSGKKVGKIAAALAAVAATGTLYFLFQSVFKIFLPSGKLF